MATKRYESLCLKGKGARLIVFTGKSMRWLGTTRGARRDSQTTRAFEPVVLQRTRAEATGSDLLELQREPKLQREIGGIWTRLLGMTRIRMMTRITIRITMCSTSLLQLPPWTTPGYLNLLGNMHHHKRRMLPKPGSGR
jgi:hypothetical protein